MGITATQYEKLMAPLNATRVAKRSQGGKQLSYLEAFDVKAHLIRIFGFGNFDSEMTDSHWVATREYQSKDGKDMVEVSYKATLRLTIRDPEGNRLCRYTEAAVGSASGPSNTLGDLSDNALKSAASDALKRCAINLGTAFGLSLYDNGNTRDIVKGTLVKPEGVGVPVAQQVEEVEPTEEQERILTQALGASRVSTEQNGEPA